MIDFYKFFRKSDWYNMFLASLLLCLAIVFSMMSKIVGWIFIFFCLFLMVVCGYFAFFKKIKGDDELDKELDKIKDFLKKD
jgi:hypothetical protein